MHKTSKSIRQCILKVLWRKVQRKMVEEGLRGATRQTYYLRKRFKGGEEEDMQVCGQMKERGNEGVNT